MKSFVASDVGAEKSVECFDLFFLFFIIAHFLLFGWYLIIGRPKLIEELLRVVMRFDQVPAVCSPNFYSFRLSERVAEITFLNVSLMMTLIGEHSFDYLVLFFDVKNWFVLPYAHVELCCRLWLFFGFGRVWTKFNHLFGDFLHLKWLLIIFMLIRYVLRIVVFVRRGIYEALNLIFVFSLEIACTSLNLWLNNVLVFYLQFRMRLIFFNLLHFKGNVTMAVLPSLTISKFFVLLNDIQLAWSCSPSRDLFNLLLEDLSLFVFDRDQLQWVFVVLNRHIINIDYELTAILLEWMLFLSNFSVPVEITTWVAIKNFLFRLSFLVWIF